MKMGLYANINAKRNRIKAQKAAGKTPERMKKAWQQRCANKGCTSLHRQRLPSQSRAKQSEGRKALSA
jgi:hypothetical protein